IADALSGPSRARGAHVRRSRQNDFPIICRDELDSRPARPSVTDKALAVPLSARSVLLIIKVPSELLFKARRNRHEWSHPLGLSRLACRNHIEPGSEWSAWRIDW